MSGVSGGAEGQRKDSYQFYPNRLTVVLRDHLFFTYLDMVLRLAGMLEHLGHWAESCPCHEDVQLQGQAFRRRRGASRFQQRRRNRHDCRDTANFYKLVDVCPKRGRRLPELVVDGVSSSIAELSNLSFIELLQTHQHLLSPEQWQIVVADFESGKLHAQCEFSAKLDWTKQLPWKLAVFAHSNTAVAIRELQEAMCQFDEQTRDAPDLQRSPHHHPVTLSLLGKGTQGRLELEHFVAGRRSLQQLPLLQHCAGCFRFTKQLIPSSSVVCPQTQLSL